MGRDGCLQLSKVCCASAHVFGAAGAMRDASAGAAIAVEKLS
jgi:hypothetical protein